ncbi:ATP-binding protein [Paenibacillus sp. NPDC056722]|uniref:ATP-binding protein n=1 Tax=Paenibacillus sp. NPDC056722 TaxID=3345924 RepID=UPI0036C788CB
MKKIVFVAGIHGVGKTYLCNSLTKELDVPHFSASKLISKQRDYEFSISKRVQQIKENQDFLISAIHNYTQDFPTILLDGHFCLLNEEGNIERLPEETFEKLNPVCFLLIVDNASTIASRLKERDGIDYDVGFLDCFQNSETEYAKEIAEKNSVPLVIHSIDQSQAELFTLLKSYL